MKKSLLALAVLGAFAGAASAQSSVTVFGRVDEAVGKQIGAGAGANRSLQVGDFTSASRLGFRGTEDLGNGLKANFAFEHRFNPDAGAAANAKFWNAYSWVGVSGAFGAVSLGRQYSAAFTHAQNAFDPFGGDTVGALRSQSLMHFTPGDAGSVRTDNSIRYEGAFGGLKVAASIGVKETNAAGVKNAYSVAANYTMGGLFIAAAYDNPSDAGTDNDRLLNLGASYDFGGFKLIGAVNDGRNTADQKVRGYLLAGTVALGGGEVKVGYATNKNTTSNVIANKKFALGYYYPLSKRTTVYTDIARDNANQFKAAGSQKTGFDVGVRHVF